jgi:arginase
MLNHQTGAIGGDLMKNSTDESIHLIGYACGIGAGIVDCSLGPQHIKDSLLLNKKGYEWVDDMLTPKNTKRQLEAIPAIVEINTRLANITSQLTENGQFFITIGGDHTCALGTWSGVVTAILPKRLGLLWIDAHLDSHTPQTTPSGNIHGMPLAALLGYGDASMTHISTHFPKLLPENVCVLGVRSFEEEEQQLLERLNVRVFYMNEIRQKGLEEVLDEAITHITEHSDYWGISLDLDAIDPADAPGVGTPEPQGISFQSLYDNFPKITENPRLVAGEIAEFNPMIDTEGRTEKIVVNLLEEFKQGYEKGKNT